MTTSKNFIEQDSVSFKRIEEVINKSLSSGFYFTFQQCLFLLLVGQRAARLRRWTIQFIKQRRAVQRWAKIDGVSAT